MKATDFTFKEIVTSGAEWSVIAGGGSIDADGVYTVDAALNIKHSVVAAALDLPIAYFTGYLILPIPLIDLEEVKRVIA